MNQYSFSGLEVAIAAAVCFGILWLQRHKSADRRRSSCVSGLLVCFVIALSPFIPNGYRLQLPPDARVPAPINRFVVQHAQAENALGATYEADTKSGAVSQSPGQKTEWASQLPSVGSYAVACWWLFGIFAVLGMLIRSSKAPSAISSLSRYQVRLVKGLRVPACVGIPRPAVLLPADSADLAPSELEAVIRHEEAHLSKRDHLWITLGYGLCALQWFNPLAWLLLRRFRVESELAADDAVLLSGCQASRYAELLVAFSKAPRSGQTAVLAPMLIGQGGFASRVRAILSVSLARSPLNRSQKFKSFVLAGAMAASLAILLACRPATSELTLQADSGQPTQTRHMEIVQVGMKDAEHGIVVWDANGNILPSNQSIDHYWRADSISPGGYVQRYRHIVYRVEARAGDVDPETAVGSPSMRARPRPEIPPQTQFGWASSDYIGTHDGWHYFVDHFSAGPSPNGPDDTPVKDYGLGSFAPTNLGVTFGAGKMVDEGSVMTHHRLSMKPGEKLPNDCRLPKNCKAWTSMSIAPYTGSLFTTYQVITNSGRILPDDMVMGSFGSDSNGNDLYVVCAPMDEIRDIRKTQRPSFEGDLLNVPISPKSTPQP